MKTRSITLVLALAIGLGNLCAQEVGLQFYSLRNQFKKDVPGTLELISSWGITKCEGGGTYGYSMEEFQGMLKKNNLEVVCVGSSFEDLAKDPTKAIANAKAYDAKFVMCAWIPHDGNSFTIEDTKNATEVFNKAGKMMKDEGITLAYHTHGYEFRPYEDGTLFDYMAKNAEHFAFEMDIFWVQHGGEDPLGLLNKYPEKFVMLHLKDMEHGVKGNNTGHEDVETNVVLGAGQLDVAGVVTRAKELGYVKYMFIEDECSRVVQQVPKSLEFLESLEK